MALSVPSGRAKSTTTRGAAGTRPASRGNAGGRPTRQDAGVHAECCGGLTRDGGDEPEVVRVEDLLDDEPAHPTGGAEHGERKAGVHVRLRT